MGEEIIQINGWGINIDLTEYLRYIKKEIDVKNYANSK